MTLDEYLKHSEKDNNLFWRLSRGEHQNLLDEAIERIESATKRHVEAVKMLLPPDCPDEAGDYFGLKALEHSWRLDVLEQAIKAIEEADAF